MEDDGFISTAGKVHLQKFWIPLLHWSVSTAAKVHLQKFWTLLLHWNDVLNEQKKIVLHASEWYFRLQQNVLLVLKRCLDAHMAFRWP